VTYEWRKDGVGLSDGGNVTGSGTATLKIAGAGASDSGSYDVVVTDSCTGVTSAAVELAVEGQPAVPVITAATSVGAGGGGTASVPSVSGHTWEWSISGGTLTSGQGSPEVEFEAGAAGTTMTLEVVEKAAGGCASEAGVAKVQVDFLDVPPTHLFHTAIVDIARAGITGGCGGGNYCPDAPVTRDQMAVFILRGEHGGSYQPPAATGTMFSDVSVSTPFAKWIEKFGQEGISTGCGGGAPPPYCPTGLVTRDAMAVFLLRGKHGSGFTPPDATGTVFGDVTVDTPFAKWIEQLDEEGIASGCGGGNYCPQGLVHRGEMAAFIKRTFGL
jgi:hypothetical protein